MIGKKVQNYEIKAHLGEGGMGTVYRAGDSVLDREVALKMLHAPLLQQPLFLERFKKEARVLAQLLHPNIAVIYNMIEQDNNHFMVMEYVEGKNLDALLRHYRMLSYKIVIPVFIQALEGLHHAHKKRIYHRDIKPSNLILTPDGTVKLMDFGIAMVAGEQRLTQVNRVVGTVEYIAPEIIQGKEPSVATDLYAVGITMYELLTGKLPFEGNTDYNLMQDILKKKPLAVEKMNASVPKALSQIVMKALEKKPGDRFLNAKEFQQALVTAFPDLQFAELNTAYINDATATNVHPATEAGKIKPRPTFIAKTGIEPSRKILSLLTGLQEKIRARENRLIVFSLSAVVLTIVLVLVFMPSNPASDTRISSLQSPDSVKESSVQNIQNKVKETTGGSLPVNQSKNPDNISFPEIPVEKKEKNKDVKEEKKPEDKKKENNKTIGEKKPDETKKEDNIIPTPPEEKKEDTKPVEVRTARSVKLTSSVDVNLYLREALNEKVKAGQNLYFTVTSPVSYKGNVIIEKGAAARGTVRSVGRKKISIVITSVTTANGQTVSVQEEELSGRIEDMIRIRNYSATLKKGITINF